MTKYKLEGLDEVLKVIKDLENLPQKCVNKSARNGASISHKDAKSKAPFLTGALEEGIILKPEKTIKKGKKVYQITMNNSMNSIFQKKNAEGEIIAYYPASMEHGFKLKNGGKVEGLHFMRKSIDNNSSEIEKTMVKVLADEIDKLR